MGKHRKLVDALSLRLEKLERKLNKRRRHSSSDDSREFDSCRTRSRSRSYRRRSPTPRSQTRRSPTPRSQTRRSRTPHRRFMASSVSEYNLQVTPSDPIQTKERGGAGLDEETVTAPTPKVITDEPISLVPEIEGLLGQEGTPCINNSIDLHECLVQRWTAILKDGLNVDTKDSVMKKYDPPRNCELLVAPKLNDEVAAAMNDSGIKRDKRISGQQAVLASAITAVGKVLNTLITDGQNTQVIEALSDSARLLCDLYHDSSVTRRALILPGLNKDLKELMEKTPISEFLFGDKLQERVTACKAVKKSAQELKNTQSQPKLPVKPKGNLNFRGPQRQMPRPSGPRPKMRRMAAPTMNRPKRSPQRQQHHPHRRGRSRR